MRLIGANGDEIELRIVGYQFPDAPDPRQRYSWYMIEGQAATAGQRWRFRWQALACDEPPLLTRWLRGVAAWTESSPGANAEPPTPLEFMEPNLRFEALDRIAGTVTIDVVLDQGFRPPRDSGTSKALANPAVLRLDVDAPALRRAADELDEDIAQYPDGSGGPPGPTLLGCA